MHPTHETEIFLKVQIPLQLQKASDRLPSLELIGKWFSEVTVH